MHKCEVCAKSVGENYYSLPNTHDEYCKMLNIDGLTLCGKCCDALTPQYKALVEGKCIENISKRELNVKYVETLVKNGFDIAPFLFKEDKPAVTKMLETINEYSDTYYFCAK